MRVQLERIHQQVKLKTSMEGYGGKFPGALPAREWSNEGEIPCFPRESASTQSVDGRRCRNEAARSPKDAMGSSRLPFPPPRSLQTANECDSFCVKIVSLIGKS
jgi:hypothetical protein